MILCVVQSFSFLSSEMTCHLKRWQAEEIFLEYLDQPALASSMLCIGATYAALKEYSSAIEVSGVILVIFRSA